MMRLHILAILIIGVCIQASMADTIELWNGKTAENVTVMGVKDGILKFKRDGKVSNVKLTLVKNIIRISDNYKISHFADHEIKRVKGKVLTINITDPRDRISQPVVRVFCCIKNSKGAYELYAFQNARHNDLTRVYGLPLVDAGSYERQHFFINREDGIAYRIEIWQDGELRALREETNEGEELPPGWYKTMRIKATRTFKVLDSIDIAGVEREQKEEKEAPPAICTIRTVSVKPTPGDKDTASVTVYYSLVSAGKDRVLIPEVNFHYVTEDKDGNRDIAVLKVDDKSGRETTLISGRTNRTVTAALPSGVRTSLLEVTKGQGSKRVIYWLVEAKYGTKIVHTKENNNPTVKRSLPEEWWKE